MTTMTETTFPVYPRYLFYIRSSSLNSFGINTYFGVTAYYRNLWGVKISTPQMKEGTKVHESLGMKNRKNKEKYITGVTDKCDVILEGMPDCLNPMIEMKTTEKDYASYGSLRGAVYQLLAYMFLFDKPVGKAVFVNRNTYKEVDERVVWQNNDYLFDILAKFCNKLLAWKHFPAFNPSLLNKYREKIVYE